MIPKKAFDRLTSILRFLDAKFVSGSEKLITLSLLEYNVQFSETGSIVAANPVMLQVRTFLFCPLNLIRLMVTLTLLILVFVLCLF